MNHEKILKLDQDECGVLFRSLNDRRTMLLKEQRPTDAVDDMLLKVIQLIETPPPNKERRHERDR